MEVEVDKHASSQQRTLRTNQDKIHQLVKGNHDRCGIEPVGRCTKMQYLKSAQNRGSVFWQTVFNANVVNDSVPLDCLIKVVRRKSRDIFYQKTKSMPQATPRVYLRSAWQAQHEGTERLVADVRYQVLPPEEFQKGGRKSDTIYCKNCASNHVSSRQKQMDCRKGGEQQHSTHCSQRAVEGDDSFVWKCRRLRAMSIVRKNPVPSPYEILNERSCIL